MELQVVDGHDIGLIDNINRKNIFAKNKPNFFELSLHLRAKVFFYLENRFHFIMKFWTKKI